jgi:hypothetical protein
MPLTAPQPATYNLANLHLPLLLTTDYRLDPLTREKADELMLAIMHGRKGSVKRLLASTNPVMLRKALNHMTLGNALTFSLLHFRSPKQEYIFNQLLYARDPDRKYHISVNDRNDHGDSLGNLIICSLLINNTQAIQMLKRIVERAREPGQPDIDFAGNYEGLPLKFWRNAFKRQDPELIRLLINARHRDGRPVFSVNYTLEDRTLLDLAEEENCSKTIKDILREAGGLTFFQLHPISFRILFTEVYWTIKPALDAMKDKVIELISQQRLALMHFFLHTLMRRATRRPQDTTAIQQFNRDAQNTHDSTVAISVKNSINALEDLYGASLDTRNIIKEISAFIVKYDFTRVTIKARLSSLQKQRSALAYLQLMANRQMTLHSHTGLTNGRILALIWHAVRDDSVLNFPEEIRRTFDEKTQTSGKAPDRLVAIKKDSFIEKFIEADLEYRQGHIDMDMCVGGGIHKLVESLNHAHRVVLVLTGLFSVLPAANAAPKSLLREALLKRPIEEQRRILANWSDDDEKSIALEFKATAAADIKVYLEKQFAGLLTPRQINDITGQYTYFPMPVIHAGLDHIMQLILAIPSDSAHEKESLATLKLSSQEIYADTETPLEAMHQHLLQDYEDYQVRAKAQVIKAFLAQPELAAIQILQPEEKEPAPLLKAIKNTAEKEKSQARCAWRLPFFQKTNAAMSVFMLLAELDHYAAHELSEELDKILENRRRSARWMAPAPSAYLVLLMLMVMTAGLMQAYMSNNEKGSPAKSCGR